MNFAQWRTHSIFFLTLLIHFFTLSNGYETHEFLESSPIYQIYDTKSYNDGTVLLHMINGNIANCYNPELYFRLIYSNGTVNSLNIPAKQIPRFNFCKVLNDIIYQPNIKVWPFEPNFIYVTYLNSSGIDASVYGLLINWSGKILSNSFIDKATINLNGIVFPPGPLYYSKGNKNNGFLYVRKHNTSDIIWSHYALPTIQSKQSIRLLRKGVIKGEKAKYVKFFGFSQFTNGFYLILARSYDHPDVASDLANINLRIDTYFINANNIKEPVPNVIYQSPVQNLNVTAVTCGIDYKGNGISCLFYLSVRESLKNLFGVRIKFRSNGATAMVKEVPTLGVTGTPELNLKSLASGGYLFTVRYNERDKQSVYGYVLNATGYIQGKWPLPQPISTTARDQAFDILPNGTIVAVTKHDNNNFTVITSGFPKSLIEGDVGYFNPLIISTYPSLNGKIPLRATKLNITYSEPIAISSQNILIYQYFSATGFHLLRQTYPASVGFTNDNKTLTIGAFDSTFNKPNSSYHIIVEYDAVRLKNNGEPILGIQDNVWNTTTENRTIGPIIVGESVVGFVRLSPEGTEKFNSLDEKGKRNFMNNLGKELAFIVPIEENRIVPLNRYQKDQKTKEKRILLAYKIGLINNNTTNITAIGESPEGIMNDLQALISHGGLTLVSNLKHTKNLDNSYGFVRKRGIFRNNRTQIILFAVYLIVVFLLISVVYCLNRQAKIDVILKFILALVTFVFYTIHTYEDAKDVERLALASVLLLILPFVIKLSLGLFIISQESKTNIAFHDWLEQHRMITFFFTFLSGVDLDAIMVLSSKMEESLDASLSEKANKWIDNIEHVGFFLKDLPQLVVLVLYYILALDYGIVPFFALISLIILIVYVIIRRFCVWCRRDKRLKLSRVSISDDLLRESPSSSGSSWWKNIISKPGSLLEKLGLGRLSKLFRRKHTAATTIVDESGHVIGELSKRTPVDDEYINSM
ncbi:unnamed protein product [Rhizophagus irregularis]|nr:unnamed protein product [Rhizophagus irregularis]CAB4411579.1 unnamed protein product [Rhizophagus irregularis]